MKAEQPGRRVRLQIRDLNTSQRDRLAKQHVHAVDGIRLERTEPAGFTGGEDTVVWVLLVLAERALNDLIDGARRLKGSADELENDEEE